MSGHAVGRATPAAVLSWLAETMREPSGLNATPVTVSRVAGQRLADGLAGVARPTAARCRRQLPEAMRVPVGAKRHAVHTVLSWPVSGRRWVGRCRASHSRTVLSALPEAMRVPSGLNATLYTAPVWPVERRRRWVGRCAASHTRTVSSSLPETIRVPSGLNATLYTAPVWPVSGCADGLAGVGVPHPHGAGRHRRRRSACPSGLNATLHTGPLWPVSGSPTGWPVVGVPQPHGAVGTAGDDPRAVGAKRHAAHAAFGGRSAAGRSVDR